jgi:hypothetical protein
LNDSNGGEAVLRSAYGLKGFTLGATDGDVGSVEEVYFDDARWGIRYLVVDTGGWLSGRTVLISPISIRGTDWGERTIKVDLTRKQVEESPDIDTDKPVSRQHEIAYFGYYGYPWYWGGPYLWGVGAHPLDAASPLIPVDPAAAEVQARIDEERAAADHHLRSSAEVIGYSIHATDDDIGHVDDFLFDDASWAIRYMVVDTRNWWPGKKVLVSPQWIERIDWPSLEVFVKLTRATVKDSPEYDPSNPPTREYEAALHRHYGQSGYWSESER